MAFFFRHLFAFAGIGLFWLLHWLPLSWLRALGAGIGRGFYHCAGRRRRIGEINLKLCFPDWPEAKRRQVLQRHFVVFTQAFLDRCWMWWSPRAVIEKRIRCVGEENLLDNEKLITLAPHFVGLDAGGLAVSMRRHGGSMYYKQKNPVFDACFLAGRSRFHAPLLFSRQDGIRGIVKAIKGGTFFYYLPDMDLGKKESIFVPFFGVPAATVPGVSRLSRITGAKVVACITELTQDGYETRLLPPWENYPGESIEADTARMNREIEQEILKMPHQYFWLHKRFKTRPPGEAKVY
ncbi:MAG: lipid A biosynthesis acyltransferase [Zoogloeaceae bacterium]|jgi:KDO2-lipid IV(A) lauroyltransferase|nr:lipid A biosynthesis acyltransferase [Zoogloeaceae bacterium]